jgi:phage tail-like protein
MPTIPNLLNIFTRLRFRVEIDGINQTRFKEIDGISVNIDAQEFREGTDLTGVSRTVSGLIHYGPLVLRNAVTGNTGNKDLWTWIKQVIDGEEAKKNVSIVVMDRKGNDKLRLNLTKAWPSSWRLGRLNSHSDAPLIEEMVLQYESLDVA